MYAIKQISKVVIPGFLTRPARLLALKFLTEREAKRYIKRRCDRRYWNYTVVDAGIEHPL